MRSELPPLARPVLSLARSTTAVPNCRIGDLVSATVIQQSGQTVALRIDGRLIEAQTELTLLAGQTFTVKVEAEAGRLLLRLLDRPPLNDPRLAALRAMLPRQTALKPVFDQLSAIAAHSKSLPAEITDALRTLLACRPTPQQLATPAGLEQALRNSGLLLESRLASPDPDPDGDLKGILLRLAAAALRRQSGQQTEDPADFSKSPQASSRPGAPRAMLEMPATRLAPPTTTSSPAPTPPPPATAAPQPRPAVDQLPPPTPAQPPAADGQEAVTSHAQRATSETGESTLRLLQRLVHPTGAAISRLQTHQLNSSLQQDQQGEAVWLFELPIRDHQRNESLLLRIRRGAPAGDGRSGWSVTLQLELAGYGPLQAVVILSEGVVSAHFQAERESTTDRFLEALPMLRERLIEQGLTADVLGAVTGPVDGDSGWGLDLRSDRLLSERV